MRALLPCVLACLLGVSVAGADSLVNDRSLDAIGDAQYTPHVAVINTFSGLNLVCVWENLKVSGLARDYRIGISQNPLAPGYGWVMHGSPPAPAGYIWVSDLQIAAPTPYYGAHGRFLITGTVRTPTSPYTFGLASVRGVADDENTLTWDTPTLIETFGSQLVQSRYIGAISMDVESNSDNVYLGYVNLLTDANSNALWFRTSTDLGVTWSARSFVGNDSTRLTSAPWIKCGAFPGWATFFYLAANDTNSYSLYSKDTFSYGASFNPLQLVRTMPTPYQTSPFGLRNDIGAPGLEIDRSTSLHQFSMYLGYAEEIDHGAVAYPPIGSSPARSSVEPDGHAILANPATPGTVLRGTLSGGAPPDTDAFAFSLAAGQSVEAHIDSAQVPGVPMLWYGPDGVSWLTFARQNCEFAAPVAGTYYLALTTGSFASGGYRVRTVSTPPPAGQARDQRDAFLSTRPYFDVWQPKLNLSAPTTPVGYDESGVRLTANLDGGLYATWQDWSVQAGKQVARFTVSRSTDGGQTWGALHGLPSVNSDWTHVPVPSSTGLIGPWGDVASDGKAMFFVWTDARNGDADVYSRTVWRSMTILSSTPSAVTTHAGGVVHVQMIVQNLDDLFDWNLLLRARTFTRDWVPQDMNVNLGVGATTTYDFVLTVPDSAAPGTLSFTMEARSSDATSDYFGSAPLALTIVPPSGVDAEAPVLDLAPVAPNPASSQATVTFSLSQRGPARLAVFDVSGRLVRRLEDGELSAGLHTRVWNGADESGGMVRAGAYFVQLEAEGKRLHRRLVWVR